MIHQLLKSLRPDLVPDEHATVAKLLATPNIVSWRAECFQLGHSWFQHQRPPEELTQFGLDLGEALEREPAAVVTELLLGYAAAREEERSQELAGQWRKRVGQLDGLHRIISAANSTAPLDTSLSTVVETVAEVMGSDVCSIFVFDRDRTELRLRATYGLSKGAIGEVNIRLGEGITGLAAQEGQPIAVADVRGDRRVVTDSRLNEQRYRSILCVPVILFARDRNDYSGDQLQGVVSVQTVVPRSWSQDEIHFLEVVAGELAFFIANAQRYQETDERLHQKIRELSTLQQVSSAIAASLDLQTVLELIADQAVVLSKVDRADIYQYDPENDHLELIATCGGEWDERLRRLIMRTVTEGHPLAVVNADHDYRFPELAGLARSDGYQSLFCIPLRIGLRIMGVIALYARKQRQFDYEEVQLLSTFADEAAIAVENARLYREAQRSLRIKSTLLQEMHHRVRNNLQTIEALLQMQYRRLDPGSRGATVLAQSAGRIQAMAAVHNLLCREDIGMTTVQQIAEQIVQAVQDGVAGDKPVQFCVLDGAMSIGSREATVVALVINELLDNALSHGLAVEGGRIEIASWSENGHAVIEVRDDGPLHPEAPAKQSSGLGRQIIETLVTADLGGAVQFSRDEQWFRARICFPHVAATAEVDAVQGAGI